MQNQQVNGVFQHIAEHGDTLFLAKKGVELGAQPVLAPPRAPMCPTMPLTHFGLKNAHPAEKPYKLSDGGGLHLLIQPNGSKLWRLKYRFLGKEQMLSFGACQTVWYAKRAAIHVFCYYPNNHSYVS